MDPMTLLEEERRLKEETELREYSETVVIDESSFFANRDLTGKGKDVHPSGKQRKIVNTIAETLIIRKPPKWRVSSADLSGGFDDSQDYYDENSVKDFDLTLKPRIFITSGPISKREPDKMLWRVSKRVLFLFNDVLLLTTKKEKEANDIFEVQQILWVKDLRLKHLQPDTPEDNLAFEIVINKTRNRPKSSIYLSCDNEDAKNNWIHELESVLLAYHRETELSLYMGWFHEIIQGTFHSAAYLGDLVLLRKHLNMLYGLHNNGSNNNSGGTSAARAMQGGSSIVDKLDHSGMSALHWACLKNQDVCARLLLDRGADVDVQQGGLNTPLLLAASTGNETISRLLLERGANITARNHRDHDAVFMAVVYGHASKGLPWTLQLLNTRGLDLNRPDRDGATPLHVCAEKNLARPVRMLVDSGADVNTKHGRTQLTPLQMACSHVHPDVETIRSFLDKGAYPNWRDLQGRTAFDLAFHSQQQHHFQPVRAVNVAQHNRKHSASVAGDMTDVASSETNDFMETKSVVSNTESVYGANKQQFGANPAFMSSDPSSGKNGYKWRAMEGTLEKVGDWAVKALPALLEISKKGGRFDLRDLDSLRPSFRAAVMEARDVWEKKAEPANFVEFVTAREQAGEDLLLHKEGWTKNNNSPICQLCSGGFGLTVRRHHCRSCGVLTCDNCSSKRLTLSGSADPAQQTSSTSATNVKNDKDKKKDDKRERVCDGCFNRLCFEAAQPSPDHFRVKQLKQSAVDVIKCIEELIDSLDDPDGYGEPSSFHASIRDTVNLTKGLGSLVKGGGAVPGKSKSPGAGAKSGEERVDVLKIREARLNKAEDIIAKFLESADGYHRITKRLIEKKVASNRLWGGGAN